MNDYDKIEVWFVGVMPRFPQGYREPTQDEYVEMRKSIYKTGDPTDRMKEILGKYLENNKLC